jgi:hypothetical protein
MSREIKSIADAKDHLMNLSGIVEKAELMYERTGSTGATIHEYKAVKLIADLELRDLQRAIDRRDTIDVIKNLAAEAQREAYVLLKWVGRQLTIQGGHNG